MITVKVNGVAIAVRNESCSLTDALCEASMCRFNAMLPSVDGEAPTKFVKGAPMSVEYDGAQVYSGYINNIREDDTVPSMVQQDVDCIDQHYLAEKRYGSVDFKDASAGWVVKYLVDNFLAAEGVTYTADSIHDAGIRPKTGLRPGVGVRPVAPQLKRANYQNMKISLIIDDIAKRAGYWWCNDNVKVTWFQPPSAYPTETGVTVDDFTSGTIVYSKNNDRYVNKCIIKNAMFPTERQEKTFKADGFGRSYVLGYPLNEKPTIVVSGRPVPADEIGVKGVDTNCDWYYKVGDPIVESNLAAPPIGVWSMITISYVGQYPGTATYQDDAEVAERLAIEGGTGIVEQVIDCSGSMTKVEAELYAKNLVDNYIKDYIKFTFPTLRSGLNPGDYVSFTVPQYGMDGLQLVIEQVSYKPSGSTTIYTVTATNIPMRNKWIDAFKNMS